ncbi:MAG: GNAT family N-acetyltransferase [Proteobacteria bacterium]|nr:GNAT family N-acetyltransferase [Pseudomonadota bacterium]
MKPTPDIRPATREDARELLGLIRALADYEKLAHMVSTDEAMLERELFASDSPAEALICRVDGEAVGMAIYCHNFSTFLGRKGLYLEDLFVKQEHRGRGYGKALLLATARIAHQRNCGRFEWMVLDWNTPSIRFYESLGAKRLDEWRLFRVTGEALEKLAGKSQGNA